MLLPILVFIHNCFTQFAVVNADNLNVVYVSVDNPISVSVSNFDVSNIHITVDDGSITGDSGKYIWNNLVSKPGGANLFIHTKINNKDSILSVQNFKVKRVPEPILKIGGHKSGETMNIVELRGQVGIQSALYDFDFRCPSNVVEFDFQINDEKCEHINSAYFSKTILNKINSEIVKSITVTNCKVKMCDGNIVAMPVFKLYVSKYKFLSKRKRMRLLKNAKVIEDYPME